MFQPAYTLISPRRLDDGIATVTLTLGTGTWVFRLVNAVLLRPLSYADAGRFIILDD